MVMVVVVMLLLMKMMITIHMLVLMSKVGSLAIRMAVTLRRC